MEALRRQKGLAQHFKIIINGMDRRKFIVNTAGLGLALHPLLKAFGGHAVTFSLGAAGPRKPVFIYNNWSAYDELSDNKPQTEELAMRELNEIVRLKQSGVVLDYYVMDAFWFDKWGGYRTWHPQHWPHGPDKWLAACKANGILPGMWFSTNLIATHSGRFLEVIPEWQDSLATDPTIMCLFEGGYLAHLAASLQLWYDRGVRLFKFDFAYFDAATPEAKKIYSPGEILEKNRTAFMDMLKQFRERNEDILLTGYNGFGGEMENSFAGFKKTIDPRWMNVFDTIYCGDPRFSDTPMMNIWRSQDNYSDHMARQFEFNGLPLRRIDNCAFMIGTTGTCYYRADHAWKGMLILELARGGWVNVYHGNLELLDGAKALWFARAQSLYRELQEQDRFSTFGPIPGKGRPYGFAARGRKGTICTVVNPSQETATMVLPVRASSAAIIYADGGYLPTIKGNTLTLGAEQLVVAGFGGYADGSYSLGIDETIQIPLAISKLDAPFQKTGKNRIGARISAGTGIVPGRYLRIFLQQCDSQGLPHRSWGGAPPDGRKMNALLQISAEQDGRQVPLRIEYDKMIWSGLSWAAAEINPADLAPGKDLLVRCASAEAEEWVLSGAVYSVEYAG